jgi:spermidine/putrescine transport system ATP-binding protein
VADFIGETNFLDGKIVEKDGARVKVEAPQAPPLWAVTPKPISPGAEVSVTIRPEKMHLRPTEGATNVLHGRVTSIVYIGTDTHYGVVLPGGQEVRIREQNSKADSRFLAQEGDAVTVYFAPEAARVLTE